MTGVMFRAPRGLLNRAKDHRCGPARYQLSQFPFRCTWDKSHRELPGAAYGAAGQRLVNVRASSRSGQPALQPEHGSPPAWGLRPPTSLLASCPCLKRRQSGLAGKTRTSW